MKKIITVIVPIYNVSKYLRKCLDSIIAQTYTALEIILVDDGSPDDCGEICDEYAAKDTRIKVIHKENGGLSSARNAGLDAATGCYIGFVDSDDWIEPSMYEEMVDTLEKEQCDMIECGVNLADEKGLKKINSCKVEVLTGREALLRHMDKYRSYPLPIPAVWSKLYKSDFWSTNRFPEGEIHEDYLLTCRSLYESIKVGFIYKGLYNHLVDNPGSIVNAKFSKRDLYKGKQYEFRLNYLLDTHDEELIELAKIEYYYYCIEAIWKCDQNGLITERDQYINQIKNNRKDYASLSFPRKKKIELFLIQNFTVIYLQLRRLLTIKRTM